jgi:hypothetical protein
MLLGVVYHAAESFEQNAYTYWAIGDNSSSLVLDVLRHASHSFRIQLFFLIAGFFASLLVARRGLGTFVRNRLSRILVPFIIGWAVLYPLLVFLWMKGAAKSGYWVFVRVPEDMRRVAPVKLTAGLFATGEFLNRFDLTHLWFLHQLLAIYVLVVLARYVLRKLPGGGEGLTSCLDRGFRTIMTSWWQTPALMAVSLPFLYIQYGWTVDTPRNSLVPMPASTLLFGLIFVVGWTLYRQPDLLEFAAGRWKHHLILGFLLVLPSRFITGEISGLGSSADYRALLRTGHYMVYGLMMWSLMLGFLGLFVHYRRQESARWRYIADSAYWVYIAHVPLVVSLQIWVVHWPLHWTIKFPLINLVAFPLLYLSYHYLVRRTFIGKQLNGRRYP